MTPVSLTGTEELNNKFSLRDNRHLPEKLHIRNYPQKPVLGKDDIILSRIPVNSTSNNFKKQSQGDTDIGFPFFMEVCLLSHPYDLQKSNL